MNIEPKNKRLIGWIIITIAIIIASTFFGITYPIPPIPGDVEQSLGISHFSGMDVSAPTEQPTNEPAMVVDNAGVSNILDIRDGGTPALVVDADGNTTISGTCSGCSIDSGSGLRITQPTAAATATPALAINSLAAGSKLLEVMDASTPVFNILNGGAWNSTGAGTHSGGQTVNNWVIASAPTAIATATPAVVIDSLGVSNILEVRDAATPVFYVNNGGAWGSAGAGTHDSGQTVNNWAVVAAPTAIATATPAMVVDSLGVSVIFEVRDAATPVASINDGGVLDLKANAPINLGNAGTDFTATGGLDLAGDLDLAALVQWGFADNATSDGDTITPTVTVYSLDTSGAVTITLAASADEGQLLVLINDDANATIIADTNIRSSDGNAVTMAGAYDVTVWIYQDSEWLLLLAIANS